MTGMVPAAVEQAAQEGHYIYWAVEDYDLVLRAVTWTYENGKQRTRRLTKVVSTSVARSYTKLLANMVPISQFQPDLAEAVIAEDEARTNDWWELRDLVEQFGWEVFQEELNNRADARSRLRRAQGLL